MATAAKQRKTKTAEDLRKERDEYLKKLALLDQKIFGSALDDELAALRVKDLFAKVKKNVAGVTDVAILTAIGKAAGMKNVQITEVEKTRVSYSDSLKEQALKLFAAGKKASEIARELSTAELKLGAGTVTAWKTAADKKAKK